MHLRRAPLLVAAAPRPPTPPRPAAPALPCPRPRPTRAQHQRRVSRCPRITRCRRRRRAARPSAAVPHVPRTSDVHLSRPAGRPLVHLQLRQSTRDANGPWIGNNGRQSTRDGQDSQTGQAWSTCSDDWSNCSDDWSNCSDDWSNRADPPGPPLDPLGAGSPAEARRVDGPETPSAVRSRRWEETDGAAGHRNGPPMHSRRASATAQWAGVPLHQGQVCDEASG